MIRFNSKENIQLQRIDLPRAETTSYTFGGDNLDGIFVTTGIKPDFEEVDAEKIIVDGLKV